LRGEEIRERETVRAAIAGGGGGGGGGGGDAGEGENTKEGRVWLFGTRKESTGGNAWDRRESKYTAGENIGPHVPPYNTHERAHDLTSRARVCAHAHTCVPGDATFSRTHAHADRSHGRAATPTHRLHTYVGTVHIKLGGCALSFAAAQE